MKTAQALLQEFDAIDGYLKAVREIVQSGHMPDMTGLDQRVSDLCLAVQGADQDVQQRCVPRLSNLLQELDKCAEEIRETRGAVKDGTQ